MILIIIFKEWSHILGIMMDDENEKIALEVLRDFLKTNFSFEGSFEHEVKAHILSAKDEEKYLISAENKIFHERVKFKIRELEENLELKKYQKRFYPHELYTKDKTASINSKFTSVTGGMARKVEEAIKISKMGMNVFFVNGKKPERIVAVVKNREFKGTMFRGKRNGR